MRGERIYELRILIHSKSEVFFELEHPCVITEKVSETKESVRVHVTNMGKAKRESCERVKENGREGRKM